ncbi:leucine-rich repeat protein [Holdemania filiformis]|uniref:leucine-rich repeat protein n=1 Tax=Holdemania filiformis TaxID=61171 RepID=UPI002431BF0C|nr:leucine-rich repeat protein [Holdemania filiformis]
MKKRKWQGIISGGLALGLFFSLQPVSAQTYAKEGTGQELFGTASEHFGLDAGISRAEKRTARQTEVTIASFDPLAPKVAEQTVAVGTAQSKLNLPDTLSGMDSEGKPVKDIPVTWKSAGDPYDPATPQDYIFIAELSSGYVLAQDAELPEIIITVTGFEPTTLPENYVRVTVKAGELKTKVEKGQVLPQNIAALLIEGSLNEKDLQYIRENLKNLKTLDLEETSLTAILKSAFQNMASLENVVLPSSATAIGEQAFKGCEHLTSVNLSKVEKIGTSAFEGCTKLGEVDLTQVTSLGASAFAGCTTLSLKNGALNPNLKTIADRAFQQNTSLTQIDLSHIEVIGANAFEGCTKLGEVDLSQVTSLGASAFAGCTQLKLKAQTNLNPNLSTIGNRTFSQCSSLTQVDLSHVNTLGEQAFADCVGLSEVDLSKVAHLGAGAFKNCSSLRMVGMPENKPDWGSQPFEKVPGLLLLFENGKTYSDCSVFPSGSSVPVIEGKDIKAGETLELAVKPQLNASLTYQWSFNGTPLTAQTNPTLKIDQAQVSHSGTYQCDVTWGTLVQRAEINVKVTEIPKPTPTPTPTPKPTPTPQPVHDHNYGPMQSDPTWHYRECIDGDGAKAEIAEHTPSEWIIIEKATATKAGSKKKVCTVCGRQLEWQEIPATGPEYSQKTLKAKDNKLQISGEFAANSSLTLSEALPHKQGECEACDAIREQQEKTGWLTGSRLQLKAGKYRGSLSVEIPTDKKDGTELTVWICQNKKLVKETKKVKSGVITLTVETWPDYIGLSEAPVQISGLPGSLSLTVGEQTTLKPQPAGGSWEYDQSILEITAGQDSYTVKALKPGETTITYSAEGVQSSLKVTVTEKAAEPEPEVKKKGSIVPFAIGILVFAAAVLIGGAVFLKRQIDQSQG